MRILVQPDNQTSERTGRPVTSAMLPYIPGPSHLSAETNYYSVYFPLQFTAIGPETATPNNAVTSAGLEAHVLLLGRVQHAVQVSGTFVGTITLEVCLDSAMSLWKKLDDITTADIKQYSGIYFGMRIKISAYTSGTPLVTVLTQR
jgi:hypothetical protein